MNKWRKTVPDYACTFIERPKYGIDDPFTYSFFHLLMTDNFEGSRELVLFDEYENDMERGVLSPDDSEYLVVHKYEREEL